MKADHRPVIHHVQIAIPAGGEDTARRFYGEVLGFNEVEKPENLRARGGVWFETGNLQLHLGVDPAFTPATKAHVAFEVGEITTMRERCSVAGHPVREDEPLPGYDRFYVDDPFGNRIEILQSVS
jgi:catechol 2,3-dioxygenase-like lactoylglutathione lyase family enzyme